MRDIERFRRDFDVALTGVFESEAGPCLAHKETCIAELEAKVRDAAATGIYKVSSSGLSLREVQVVCRDVPIASFVQMQLKGLLYHVLPGEEDIPRIAERITLDELVDGKPTIHIPFEPLIIFVKAAQVGGSLENFYGHPVPQGTCDLAEGLLSYQNGEMRSVSNLARLQISNEPAGVSRILEVDLTERLKYLFNGGNICKDVRPQPIDSTEELSSYAKYLKLTRGTSVEQLDEIKESLPDRLPSPPSVVAMVEVGDGEGPNEVDTEVEEEEEQGPVLSLHDKKRRDLARRSGGLWIRSDGPCLSPQVISSGASTPAGERKRNATDDRSSEKKRARPIGDKRGPHTEKKGAL